MRLHIKRRWKANEPLQLVLPEGMIPLRRTRRLKSATHYELSWTWTDGSNFALLAPTFPIFKPYGWHVVLGEQTVCSGRMVQPGLREFFRAALPRVEWEFAGRSFYDEPGYCTSSLRNQQGRRLAVWWHSRTRAQIEVACLDSLSKSDLPVILGMVLASVFDPWP